ncbi:MAG: hypothetical protein WDO56_29410 [Gammaproteobacteria bacterium]
MKRSPLSSSVGALTVFGTAAILCGCASKPAAPLVRDSLQTVSATVEAVDVPTRMVRLQGPNGPATIMAGPDVRNFDRIEVGDRVEVSYYQGIAAQVKPRGAASTKTGSETATYRAPQGDRPGAGVGQSITTTVTIESVDTSFDTVTFRRADGTVRTLAVESDDARAYIRKLKKGDLVDVVYTEAVAVAVVPGK